MLASWKLAVIKSKSIWLKTFKIIRFHGLACYFESFILANNCLNDNILQTATLDLALRYFLCTPQLMVKFSSITLAFGSLIATQFTNKKAFWWCGSFEAQWHIMKFSSFFISTFFGWDLVRWCCPVIVGNSCGIWFV